MNDPGHQVPVRQAALAALTAILRTSAFPQTAGHDLDFDALRRQWREIKGLPPAERWYHILADDRANTRQWLEAARLIVQRTNVTGSGTMWIGVKPPKPSEPRPPMAGEALRPGKRPSVSKLMAKRALQTIPVASEISDSRLLFDAANGVRFGVALALWDGRGSQSALREIDARARAVMSRWTHGSNAVEELEVQLAALTAARLRAGDRQALADYASWVLSVERPMFGRGSLALLWPLCDSPDATASLAKRVFSGAQSPMDPRAGLDDPRHGETFYAAELVKSPLVKLPAFRECLVAMLADRRTVGTVWLDTPVKGTAWPKGEVFTRFRSGTGSGGDRFSGDLGSLDPAMPPPGTSRPYRVCDVVAAALQNYTGVPPYRPYWSDSARDAAVAKLRAFVKESGASLPSRRPEHDWAWSEPPFEWAWLW